jgi:hypothetical protein
MSEIINGYLDKWNSMKLIGLVLAVTGFASAIASVVTSNHVYKIVFFVVLFLGFLSIPCNYFIKTRKKNRRLEFWGPSCLI